MSVKIQWITWWPAPYWEPRFEKLNAIDDIELKVYYIQKGSTIHQWQESKNRRYAYEYINFEENDGIGYKFKFSNLPSIFKALRVFKEKSDVIILPYADIRFIAIILLCIFKKRKYFLFCANTIFDERKEIYVKEILKRIFFGNASAILATGESQNDYCLRYTTAVEKIKIIGNPSVEIKSGQNRNLDSNNGSASGIDKPIHLLYVGRLSREKGLYDLVHAVFLLKNSDNNFKITMVGDGPEKINLEKFSEKLSIDCQFTGFIKKLDLLNGMYKLADVFILPSYSESWGLVVNEAMQNKLPIILSDKIGCKKMLLREGENGYSFRSGDTQDLSQKIKLMVNPEKRERMGRESYKIIQHHNPENWTENVKNAIYDTI